MTFRSDMDRQSLGSGRYSTRRIKGASAKARVLLGFKSLPSGFGHHARLAFRYQCSGFGRSGLLDRSYHCIRG
jgi:hypothetical protein